MTAQTSEILVFNGHTEALLTEPLEEVLLASNRQSLFKSAAPCTALHRGYVGHWAIRKGKLLLTGLSNPYDETFSITVEDLFPGQGSTIFARWFTGELRVPLGDQLEYVHSGYSSIYEKDLLIAIEEGYVLSKTVKDNRQHPSLAASLWKTMRLIRD